MNVVGARPQFVKAGPVSRALERSDHREILVHTGQHYDVAMSDDIMRDVGLRAPDLNLGVGSGSHATQTARMLEGLEATIVEKQPDVVLTYGDTNSTIAAALAASKLGVPTGHVEAGLRSFNRSMPEELNRVATDHLSDILLAPTETAMGHLRTEGLESRSVLTGDVMVDALQSIRLSEVEMPGWADGDFLCATVHRAENTDDVRRLTWILESLANLDHPVHLLAHPRLRSRIAEHGVDAEKGGLVLHDPLPYAAMLAVVSRSRCLLTDSGGLQKEAFILGVPCVTLRDETEWPETMVGNWNVIAPPGSSDLKALMARRPEPVDGSPFGNGTAADSIVRELGRVL